MAIGIVPRNSGPKVQGWAAAAAGGLPCEVALPHREYEAWFLAAIESLRTHDLIKADAEPHPDPEEPRGAKEQLKERVATGRVYSPTTHQAALSASISLKLAYGRSRSFRKLTTSFGSLLRQMGQDIGAWPPEHWFDG